MTRRVSLPGADELFRSTGPAVAPAVAAAPAAAPAAPAAAAPAAAPVPAAPDPAPAAAADEPEPYGGEEVGDAAPPAVRRRPRPAGERRPSGRERHDEKITVYCSAEELLELERARLALRGDHGLVIDRGRIVREALAIVLGDFDAKGDQSILVRRLRGR